MGSIVGSPLDQKVSFSSSDFRKIKSVVTLYNYGFFLYNRNLEGHFDVSHIYRIKI